VHVGERVGEVSTLLDRPRDARALLVLAHGAGAGMRHAFMETSFHVLKRSGRSDAEVQRELAARVVRWCDPLV